MGAGPNLRGITLSPDLNGYAKCGSGQGSNEQLPCAVWMPTEERKCVMLYPSLQRLSQGVRRGGQPVVFCIRN